MKGKFIYHFKSGGRMIDRNGYQTKAEAQSWANAYNKRKINDKIIRIESRTPPKPKKRIRSLIGAFDIKYPKF